MTTALEGGEGLASRPGRFNPQERPQYPLYRRLCGTQGRSGRVQKISPPTGIRSLDRPAHSHSLYRLSYPFPGLRNTDKWRKDHIGSVFTTLAQSAWRQAILRWRHSPYNSFHISLMIGFVNSGSGLKCAPCTLPSLHPVYYLPCTLYITFLPIQLHASNIY